MAQWEPWHGCHKYSEGCAHCYIHKGDAKRGIDTNQIVLTGQMEKPLARYKRGAHAGEYKIDPGSIVYTCFSTDFLVEEADPWRAECWRIMKARPDLHFMFLTKRIERLAGALPEDWGDGYDNVTIGCTIENQRRADERLPIFDALPIKHKNIICQPMIGPIDLSGHLDGVSLVIVGGESDRNARSLDYAWVLSIREQCQAHHVPFTFRQTGSRFLKDGALYKISPAQQMSQARKAGIDLH